MTNESWYAIKQKQTKARILRRIFSLGPQKKWGECPLVYW